MAQPLIDLRYHSAVVFDPALVVSESTDGTVTAVDATVESARRWHAAGITTAVFASGGVSDAVLASAGIADLFRIWVDTPLPDGDGRLGIPPSAAVAVTASEKTRAHAHRAGFGLVITLTDRTTDRLSLRRSDAIVHEIGRIALRAGLHRLSEIPGATAFRYEVTTSFLVRRPVICLDFDGTSADIDPDPFAAALADGMTETLSRLAAECPVAVISGRDPADVRARVGLPGLWYAGNYGYELVGPDGREYEDPDAVAALPALKRAGEEITRRLRHVDGVSVECKRFSVTVHYRNAAAEHVDEIVAVVHDVGRRHESLRSTHGRTIVELRPGTDGDKGFALQRVLAHIAGAETAVPVYIGDDLSGEDAFDALSKDGIGIVVRSTELGDRYSAADFAADGPGGVREYLEEIAEQLRRRPDSTARSEDWILYFEGYEPDDEKLREALCTVGNGYLGTRGCAPESKAGRIHYPGTYAAGIFNRPSEVRDGTTVENESMVNLPDWLATTFRIDGGPWFDIDDVEILDFCQYLHLRRAVLTRRVRYRDGEGRITTVVQRRFAALHLPHVCALQTTVLAENWSGTVELRSSLDGSVRNDLVERYRAFADEHLEHLRFTECAPATVLLTARTTRSHIDIAMAARATLRVGEEVGGQGYFDADGSAGHTLTFDLHEGGTAVVEKTVTVFTGRDRAISEPADAALRLLADLDGFESVLDGHVLAWAHLWEQTDIGLPAHPDASRIVRLHLLHLLQTVSVNTACLDAGVPARGLHGEAYRGHIFWDELFVLPVLDLRIPGVTRSLLRYRYRRLPEARRAAKACGYRGAMYPWQSGSDGREESQQVHLNPVSGHWLPDPSRRQHHIGIAIAYNVWQHYQVTADLDFLDECGAEMLVEIARFFADLASVDPGRSRYSIRGVIGPDEFHTGYPHAPYDGIDNNAYTNVMAVWVILRAIEALDVVPERVRSRLVDRLGLEPQEMSRWGDIARRMFVPFHDGVLSQFEGYEKLMELDWDRYRRQYGNIQRLDRILEAEGKDVNRYRASKQADALMLFYLLSADELRGLLERLDYRFEPEAIPRTIDYYLTRTSHGSTLSALVHSWVLARAHRDDAMRYFETVLVSDIGDIQGGTTAEGIHLAAMAGSVDLLQRCFTGLEVRGDRLVLGPRWPVSAGPLEFRISYRGHDLQLKVEGTEVEVSAGPGHEAPIEIMCRDRVVELRPGCTVRVG
ncbi:trehalose-phosphatase [Rhodococcus sp. CH91]|uniref:trehalose-phosphatase n=1 Tax=Rhodococcus sp. CH91 TaxID=2910256 RepID=UPI001F4A5F30|nr:trehalose-phosphatase [Rhodococcus sp. CH91]